MAKIDDSVKKKVPELRFKGFTDEWEERKLKDIAQFNPKTVLPDEFEYVDLESVVGTEMISHRTESKDQAPSRAQRLAQKGDVFYQTVRPYQMNNYLYDLPYDNYVFSTGYAQMRPNIDSYFLLNSVQNKQFVQHVLDRSTGTSYPAINSSDLSNIEIHVPSKLSEQQKIGAFFQSIDDTIALHQRKLDLLKEQKKGYLQKMFPKNGAKVPESRFAGFADDWEERKFGELYKKVNEKNDLSFGKDRVISVANMYFKDTGNIRSDDAYMKTYNIFRTGDIAFEGNKSKHFSYGRFVENTIGDGIVSHVFDVFRPIQQFDLNYWKYAIHNERVMGPILMTATTSSTMMTNLVAKDFLKRAILVPSYSEQKFVGSFFQQLDDTIALHQRKLDLLKEQKKGFLQNMFV
ncbi:restriction endonuclease subunit S [Loigolactobacillus backii]|uniref:restriction endonuclease subunit S n=1 Tax=Loigolactobacillus backii TaxID=375175 RepID=UPI00082BEC4D|nr:restriction endonuclease subunit S [Loigolactobacillus backii]